MPVIPATQEADARELQIQSQPWAKVARPHFKNKRTGT
jgi:hypothetical protein